MRLQKTQLGTISRQIVKALVDAGDIEVVERREVERDLESVLGSYLTQLDQVLARARDLVQQRGLPQGEYGRIKRLAADQAGIKVDDDALDYVLDQLVSMLMTSENVEEVFGEDHQLRKRMRQFLMADEAAEQDIEAAVRSKLKHVEEGTRMWEIEYARMKEEIKRRRGSS
jgi:hypothetical protein